MHQSPRLVDKDLALRMMTVIQAGRPKQDLREPLNSTTLERGLYQKEAWLIVPFQREASCFNQGAGHGGPTSPGVH